MNVRPRIVQVERRAAEVRAPGARLARVRCILVIRRDRLGDVIVTLPALAALRRAWRERFADEEQTRIAVLAALLLISALVYLTFLAVYLAEDPSTTKASYILHVFPALALLGAEALERLRTRRQTLYRVLVALLLLVTLHNLPVLFSRQVL